MASYDLSSSKILVFGNDGQLAESLIRRLPHAHFISRQVCDFEHLEQIEPILNSYRPEIVINPAAYTNVDRAESETALAFRINAEAPLQIAKWCKAHAASLVHYSTDYVYNGEGETPWLEDSPTDPLNQYGKSKLAGDQAIASVGGHFLILRTSWLYSPFGTNFLKTMIRLGNERDRLSIVRDQIGSPTSTLDLALATTKILAHPQFKERQGVYHLTNSGYASWYDFAREIFAEIARKGHCFKVKEVLPIPASAYPTPARRPANSRLNQQKVAQDFAVEMQDWKSALRELINEYYLKIV